MEIALSPNIFVQKNFFYTTFFGDSGALFNEMTFFAFLNK